MTNKFPQRCLLSFFITFILTTHVTAQGFYKVCTQQGGFRAAQLIEQNNGYLLKSFDTGGRSPEWSELQADLNGNFVNVEFKFLDIDRNQIYKTATPLKNGGYILQGIPPSSTGPTLASFRQIDNDGNTVHEFSINIPANSGFNEGPVITELEDGTLFIVTGYGEVNSTTRPADKYFIYTHYDLANQQVINQQTTLWGRDLGETSILGIKPSLDGNIFVNHWDQGFSNKHYLVKYQTDGTQLWKTQTSSLERPVRDFAPTPDGGAWSYNDYFNSVRKINADGSFGSSFPIGPFQNSIQAGFDIVGIAAAPDNGVLVMGSASPVGDSRFYTILTDGGGSIVQSNILPIPSNPFPNFVFGRSTANGGYILSGNVPGSSNPFTPILLSLDAEGKLPQVPQIVDLELSIDGSSTTPDIYTLHNVTLTIRNQESIPATGVIVSVPTPNGSIYQGGNEFTASQGNFDWLSAQEWNVGTLGAGESATLTINYFRLEASRLAQYAEVSAQNEIDLDSNPGNGNGVTAEEDDEVTYGRASDLDLSAFRLSTIGRAGVPGGSIRVNASYGANYVANPGPATINSTIYLSSDNSISTDDFVLGTFSNMITQNEFISESLDLNLPGNISPGFYTAILSVDDENTVVEINENNNTTFSASILVTESGDSRPDLAIGDYLGQDITIDQGLSVFLGGFDAFNTGTTIRADIDFHIYLSRDQQLSNDDVLAITRSRSTQFYSTSATRVEEFRYDIPNDFPAGVYYQIAVIDATDVVDESIETNNFRIAQNTITINGTTDPCSPDVIPPSISGCPNTINLSTNTTSATANWAPPTATDNCDNNPSLTSNFNPGDTFPVGTTTVVYTATDATGNPSTCMFDIIVTQVSNNDCSDNLLQNPGFENGLANWNDRGGAELVQNGINRTSLRVCNQVEARVIQSLRIDAGDIYRLEVTGQHEGSRNFDGYFTVKFLTATWQPIPGNTFVSLPRNVETIIQDYQAPANAVYAEINLGASQTACILVDDICFRKTNGGGNDQPDLTLSNLSNIPDSRAGDNVNYTVDFNNIGQEDANGVFRMQSFISTDNTISADDIRAGIIRTGDLVAGQSFRNLQGILNIPTNLIAGDYFVILRIDDEENVVESNENNNILTRQIRIIDNNSGSPDLRTVSSTNLAGTPIGGTVDFNLNLINRGDADVSSSFVTKFYFSSDNQFSADDVLSAGGDIITNSLNSLEVRPTSFSAVVPNSLTPGLYYLITVIDADNDILESNENNNTFANSIVITPRNNQNLPDLQLANLSQPGTVAIGEVFNYTFDLLNTGTGNATDRFNIKAYFSTDERLSFDDRQDGIVPTGNLDAGATVFDVLGASRVPNGLLGDYFLLLVVDADQDIQEENESNNLIAVPITIERNNGGGGTPNCAASSDFPWEDWISRVKIGLQLDNSSGKSPYSNFTSPFQLAIDEPYPIELTTSYSYLTYDEYWRVWIDLNQNDIYEINEVVFNGILNRPPDGTASATLQNSFSIPDRALTGTTKMRVIMTRTGFTPPCGTIDFGEVEDYVVEIVPNGNIRQQGTYNKETKSSIRISPNPANDFLLVDLNNKTEKVEQLTLVNAFGKIIWQQELHQDQRFIRIDLGTQQNGIYFLRANGKKMKPESKKVMVQRDY